MDKFNVSPACISKLLKKYNITARSRASKKIIIEKEDLAYQYNILKKSQRECAKYFNCSNHAIAVRLNEYNIPIRN